MNGVEGSPDQRLYPRRLDGRDCHVAFQTNCFSGAAFSAEALLSGDVWAGTAETTAKAVAKTAPSIMEWRVMAVLRPNDPAESQRNRLAKVSEDFSAPQCCRDWAVEEIKFPE